MRVPRAFVPLLIGAAILLLGHQLSDLLLALPSVDMGTPTGRVRQLIATEARTPGLLAADALLVWALLERGRDGAIRLLGWTHRILAILLVAMIPLFFADSGRLASQFGLTEGRAFRVTVLRMIGVFGALSVGFWLASRALLKPRENVA